MKTRLINVRLDEERFRKAAALREKGVVVSDLVRAAIDAKFDEIVEAEQPRGVGGMIEDLFARYPDPVDLPPREYDVHDRAAALAAIRGRLARKSE